MEDSHKMQLLLAIINEMEDKLAPEEGSSKGKTAKLLVFFATHSNVAND